MAIVGYIYLDDLDGVESKRTTRPKSKETATGYGSQIPTELMVKHQGRWRRVYCCIFSNVGTNYITSGKDWIVIR
jgi:hypothetical protein